VSSGTLTEIEMRSLRGDDARPMPEWTTTFQLFMVALDPYTVQSAWILPTATRILQEYSEADCRTAFLMACDANDAQQFLGPLVDELMVFLDPDRTAISALGITELPALVHVNQVPAVVASAGGWDPGAWRDIAAELSRILSWNRPTIPDPNDPEPFPGSPAAG